MEIQTVTRFIVDGETFERMEDARRALAVAIMFGHVPVENLCNNMISNPSFVVAVLNDYIADLNAIKSSAVTTAAAILVDKFVQPRAVLKFSDGWPLEASSPNCIDSFSRMCEEAARLVRVGRVIDAIKMVRLCFGYNRPGLKEAKDWVEALR